ncbi:MAG: Hpt domain-containing protein [Gammaproteobacteria bacterium]|nr:Hpt domain-containing protein [Gammaproteobacteria bacterium]MDH5777195.1 Hpt domain-containing protein [Gammaproteobacteria bacterium]
MSEIFDKQHALEQAGDDPELASELFTMLIKELPELNNKLILAHEQMDYQAMWDHAHKIHGSTAYCGVPLLKAAAHALEETIKQQNASALPEKIDQVSSEIETIIQNKDHILQQLSI